MIKAAGRRLAVARLPGPDGGDAAAASPPPLVFLHEGLGSVALWRGFPGALCARVGRRGLAYDRWGHGRSEALDGPRDARYLHREAIVFLPAVLDALRLPRAALFGHSDGGTIALLFAAAFPDRVAAVVAEAAHVFVEPETLRGIEATAAAFREGTLRQRLARYHGGKTDALFAAWAETWLSPAFRGWNVEPELPRVACPVLVLQGEADQYGTPAQVEAIARGVRGPVETALLPGCGHAPHHEAPGAVLELAAAFLGRHGGLAAIDPEGHGR